MGRPHRYEAAPSCRREKMNKHLPGEANISLGCACEENGLGIPVFFLNFHKTKIRSTSEQPVVFGGDEEEGSSHGLFVCVFIVHFYPRQFVGTFGWPIQGEDSRGVQGVCVAAPGVFKTVFPLLHEMLFGVTRERKPAAVHGPTDGLDPLLSRSFQWCSLAYSSFFRYSCVYTYPGSRG